MRIWSRYTATLVPAFLLLAALGCMDSRPSVSSSTTEATVKGTVTIKGKPATKGSVVFDPSNYARKNEQPRSAPLNKDGTYSIKTLIGSNSIRVSSPEAILKLAEPASMLRFEGASHEVKAEPVIRPVVDTTAAGDSFAAAYLAARLQGAGPVEAARAGHRLAGAVVCHPGAIIPLAAMPAKDPSQPYKASA